MQMNRYGCHASIPLTLEAPHGWHFGPDIPHRPIDWSRPASKDRSEKSAVLDGISNPDQHHRQSELGFRIPSSIIAGRIWDFKSQVRPSPVESGIRNPSFDGQWSDLGFRIPDSTFFEIELVKSIVFCLTFCF